MTVLIVVFFFLGLYRYKSPAYWPEFSKATTYLVVASAVAQVFFAAGGTLENPVGDGIITARIRQATNDGIIAGLMAIPVLASVYVPFFVFLRNGIKKSKASLYPSAGSTA